MSTSLQTPGETDLKAMLHVNEHTALLRMPFVCRDILSRGFTTVRDCGGAPIALKQAVQEWLVPGPRLILAGHALTQTGGHGDLRSSHDHSDPECCNCGHHVGLARLCDGVPECLRKTRDELRQGSDFIKIMGSGGMMRPEDNVERVQFTAEEIQAITATADAAGKYATAHAYTPKTIRHAVDNGVKGIEHGNFLDLPTAMLMAEKGVFLTPTLVTYGTSVDGPFSKFIPAARKEKYQQILQSCLESTKIAKEAGVTMCLGTDVLGAVSVFQSREFSLRSGVLSPLEILQSATINPAKMMGLRDVGQIREGFSADLLVLKSNPLEDITVLDRTASELLAVFKEGRVCYSKLEGVKGMLDKA